MDKKILIDSFWNDYGVNLEKYMENYGLRPILAFSGNTYVFLVQDEEYNQKRIFKIGIWDIFKMSEEEKESRYDQIDNERRNLDILKDCDGLSKIVRTFKPVQPYSGLVIQGLLKEFIPGKNVHQKIDELNPGFF
ncbi:MAG: hypothetical protein ABIF40_01635 [archaeon]